MPRPYDLAVAFGLTILSILAARPAPADVVLDQQNDLTGSGSADSTSGGYSENAQTFTVGVTGTLARIEIQAVRFFGTDGNLIVSLYNTTGDTEETRFPAASSLASRSMAFSLVPTTGYAYQVFDFTSSSIPVTADTIMAFGVGSTPNSATGGIRSSIDQSPYPGAKPIFARPTRMALGRIFSPRTTTASGFTSMPPHPSPRPATSTTTASPTRPTIPCGESFSTTQPKPRSTATATA